MSKFLTQFEKFWEQLTNKLELSDEIKAVMLSAWQQIEWPVMTTGSSSVASPSVTTASSSKPATAYTQFMRLKISEMKSDTSMTGTERVKKIREEWKTMSADKKKSFSAQSEGSRGSSTVTKKSSKSPVVSSTEKKTRKPTGYNWFMKAMMAHLKEKSFPADKRMAEIARVWKTYGDDVKLEWKNAALNDKQLSLSFDGDKVNDDDGESVEADDEIVAGDVSEEEEEEEEELTAPQKNPPKDTAKNPGKSKTPSK